MNTNLIDLAKKEGIKKIHVAALICNASNQILLIEKVLEAKVVYQLPRATLGENESLQQALMRAVVHETAMEVEEVKTYLGHYDLRNERTYHFVVTVKDPYAVEQKTTIAHAWLAARDAVGYPITDALRQMIDTFAKI